VNEELRKIIADTLGLDSDSVDPSLSRESADAWDSLNHLRLITAVEEAFGIQFGMSEIQDINTAGELDESLKAHLETV
jgi:acyl carrier protein